MDHARELFNIAMATLGLAATSVFGGWDNVLTILLTLIVIDYTTGLIKGGYQESLSSSTGWKGLLRKGVIFLVVILAHQVDIVLNSTSPIFRTATAYFYIANEGISITENIALLGVPLPSFLIKALKAFKSNVDEMIPEVKTNEKKIRVAIRAGHGGSDRANRGPTGYIEADGNLQFALFLEEELKTDPRFEVYNIRKTDVYVPLSQGPILAAEWEADVYFAIHSDAFSERSTGVTVYESVDLDNEYLAELVGKAVAEGMAIPFRGVKSKESKKFPGEDYYTDIDKAQDLGIPFVGLIERGFHSNPHEEDKLKDSATVRRSTKKMREALQLFFFPEDNHWANENYLSLNNKGIKVHQKRFEDNIKRGEVMALLDRATDRKDD